MWSTGARTLGTEGGCSHTPTPQLMPWAEHLELRDSKGPRLPESLPLSRVAASHSHHTVHGRGVGLHYREGAKSFPGRDRCARTGAAMQGPAWEGRRAGPDRAGFFKGLWEGRPSQHDQGSGTAPSFQAKETQRWVLTGDMAVWCIIVNSTKDG